MEDCGFEVTIEKDKEAVSRNLEDLFILEVKKRGEIGTLKEKKSTDPFLIFTEFDLRDEMRRPVLLRSRGMRAEGRSTRVRPYPASMAYPSLHHSKKNRDEKNFQPAVTPEICLLYS